MPASRRSRSWTRLRPAPALLVDVGLATMVAIVVMVAIGVAGEPGSRPPDLFAYLLGAMIGALLLARRRWPLGVLVATASTLGLYHTLDYPGVYPALPLAAALYSAAAAGRLRWSLGVAGTFVGAGLFVRGVLHQEPLLPLLALMMEEASLLVAVALLGETVRSRRARLAEAQERLGRAEAEREREAARLVAEERLRIARELHDVMAHTIAAITVQAGLALDVLDDCPAEARTALTRIRAVSREAMAEVKSTVGVLRGRDGAEAPRSPSPGLDRLEGLLTMARGAGPRVDAAVTGVPRPIPAAISLTAYRIVQEALTNVIRHAGATLATVTICYEPTALGIEVADNGRGAAADPGTGRSERLGYGLVGMAERASTLGGWLEAGPRPDGGFVVRARLPIEESPIEESSG